MLQKKQTNGTDIKVCNAETNHMSRNAFPQRCQLGNDSHECSVGSW